MAHYFDYEPDALDVQVVELLTATHDSADPLVDPRVSEALAMLRRHLHMDVIFVSQFKDQRRVFRAVERAAQAPELAPGQSDPLEESWCQFVVEGRVPQLIRDAAPLQRDGQLPATPLQIGTHLSTPIVLKDGSTYGTLCCFSSDVRDDVDSRDLDRLRLAARVLAEELEADGRGGAGRVPQVFAKTQLVSR